jgi:reverse gyrase
MSEEIICEICGDQIDWEALCSQCRKVICTDHFAEGSRCEECCNSDKETYESYELTVAQEKDYLNRLKKLKYSRDYEEAHGAADDIIIELIRTLGFDDIADAWEDVPKWYA